MTNNELLAALSMDLKRVAIMLHRKSPAAERFMQEALRWKKDIKTDELPQYITTIVQGLEAAFARAGQEEDRTAEDLLMESQIIQNYVITR